MVSKKFRLTRKDNIKRIIKEGKTIFSPFMIAKCLKNRQNNCRFGVVAGTKLLKSAPKRNRLRRQVYESIRLNKQCEKHTGHCNFVLLPKRSIIGKKYREIEGSMKKILIHNP